MTFKQWWSVREEDLIEFGYSKEETNRLGLMSRGAWADSRKVTIQQVCTILGYSVEAVQEHLNRQFPQEGI